MSIGPDQLEFVKTKVQRRKKDALAAGADSDQEDWVEEAYGSLNTNIQNVQSGGEPGEDNTPLQRLASGGDKSPIKKKRKFWYYALVYEFEFENDNDIVYFAFSQPYSYS